MFQWVVMNCECLTVVCEGCPSVVDAVLEFVLHWDMMCDGLTRVFQLPVDDTVMVCPQATIPRRS